MNTDTGDRIVDHLVVHASATEEGEQYNAADIDRWHRARGWLGNGYHFVILLDGTLESRENGNRCRPLEKPGAHVGDCGPGWNRRSVGICMIGGLDSRRNPKDTFTDAQMETLFDVLVELDPDEDKQVLGHRDLIERTGAPPKACPCFDAVAWYADVLSNQRSTFKGFHPLSENYDD